MGYLPQIHWNPGSKAQLPYTTLEWSLSSNWIGCKKPWIRCSQRVSDSHQEFDQSSSWSSLCYSKNILYRSSKKSTRGLYWLHRYNMQIRNRPNTAPSFECGHYHTWTHTKFICPKRAWQLGESYLDVREGHTQFLSHSCPTTQWWSGQKLD